MHGINILEFRAKCRFYWNKYFRLVWSKKFLFSRFLLLRLVLKNIFFQLSSFLFKIP